MQLNEILKQRNTRIIDVRTAAEFSEGHVMGSINIPLNEIPNRVSELKQMNGPIVLCCASGNRSGQATSYLESLGFDQVYNGGSWLDVNYFSSKNVAI